MKKNKTAVIIIIALVFLIALVPLFLIKGAEFGGSDEAGSEMVSEAAGYEYTPWFTPVLERLIGGELPGEMETLFFCIQTGIGVGILAFCFGYLVARKKYSRR
jgi:cobalt/nickel transport protein